MALLSKDEIFAITPRRYENLYVPEWGGEVRLRTMTGAERDEFEAGTVQIKNGKQKENMANFRARMVAAVLVDEDDKLMFRGRNEIAMLGNKPVAGLQRIFNKAQEMNGLSDEDVDELAENFEKEDDEDSTSDSPSL